jgi:hypothetical protein
MINKVYYIKSILDGRYLDTRGNGANYAGQNIMGR